MKKFVSFFMMALVAVFVLASCGTQEEKALSKLDSLVEHVEKDGATMSDEEWEKVYADYEAIGLDREELQFSDEQLEQVGEKTARILTAYGAHAKKSLGDKLKSSMKKVGGFLKGLGNKDTDDQE